MAATKLLPRLTQEVAWHEPALNPFGCIPRGLPRIRHTGESRYPENPTGFRVKQGMTAQEKRRYPAACCGELHFLHRGPAAHVGVGFTPTRGRGKTPPLCNLEIE